MKVVAAYITVYVVWVYALLDRMDAAADEPWILLGYTVVGVANAAAGILLARWWAVLLPIGPALFAIPAGYVPDGRPEFPIWLGLLFLAPFAAVVVAAGVAGAKLRAGHAAG